jgi:RNA polymerase sigma factor (sigma-70 family)
VVRLATIFTDFSSRQRDGSASCNGIARKIPLSSESSVAHGTIVDTANLHALMSDPYVQKQADIRASFLVATGDFRREDWADLKQELILDLLKRTPRFRTDRGTWRGFVRRIMQHRSATLRSHRDRYRIREVSLENVETTAAAIHDGGRLTLAQAVQTKVDLGNFLRRLDKKTRRIVDLVRQDVPVLEICKITGRSRSDVYRTIRRAKKSSEGPLETATQK